MAKHKVRLSVDDVNNAILNLKDSGTDFQAVADKAATAKRALVMSGTDGIWNIWSLIPSKTPNWLWEMVRSGNGGYALDDWALTFINDALVIASSNVRFDSNGVPNSQLSNYPVQLQSYTDDEKLMKWANSHPGRTDMLSIELQNGAGSVIGAARSAYYGERLIIFCMVFQALTSDDPDDSLIPDTPQIDTDD